MQQILDLHIHSKYSRACSKNLTLENIDKACRVKGVDIIATGDFTYPEWFKSIDRELEEIPGRRGNVSSPSGLYKFKTASDDKVKFILSTEFALIYKDGGKCRRIHLVVHAPNVKAVEKLNKYLDKHYNIRSDGRPILGMSAKDLFKLCLSIHPKFLIYPAHIWTPWFSVFGSKSGFDKLEECFGGYTPQVYAYETGLSSDPEMNWRVSELDRLTLLSNSDAHSPQNIAREANVFDLETNTYDEIYEVIKNKDLKKIKYSIEFYPEEGMYHYDGHRVCGVSFTPDQTKKLKGICPVCKKPLTVGVMYRVDELADRPVGFQPKNVAGFKKLVELDKIIAESLNIKSRSSQKVQAIYQGLIKKIGNELLILLDADLNQISEASDGRIAEGVRRVRAGELKIKPGFDGEYGKVEIFSREEKEDKQLELF
jgi:uncharacterized protein (TIGR00375 family)